MPGYLLDVNQISALFCKKPAMLLKVASLPKGTQLRACTITLGEIEAGHRMTTSTKQSRRDEYTAFINSDFRPNALPVSHSTGYYYADIIGEIWKRHAPTKPGTRTDAHLLQLGIDINDVWAVAVAMEHGLVFVTCDNMACIREVVPASQLECWAV
jgi:predicted nucleic acid-binding protein